MLYDIRLHLHYDYHDAAGGSRHHVQVTPRTIAGVQRVIASSLSFEPTPTERSDFVDFFGNAVTSAAFRGVYEALDIRMSARVSVSRPEPGLDVSPGLGTLFGEIASVRSLAPDSPHHFAAASDFVDIDDAITAYARESAGRNASVAAIADDLCNGIYRDFAYDGEATTVATKAADAFALRRGVCQDFSHVMIAGLRGLGIPAGYVSGFLRTIPPPGKDRLEGADAMHAWVMVWCGLETGWLEFDPTNGMRASNDHITAGCGRDYADVAPIVGVLRTTGSQAGEQAVDVIPVG
ncbi:transglutaminase N-terminal domain-containing protein [Mesorhizobium sp. ZMM04-5]|uniref:Transglutaminase N-terminal domain-containing protein n=1 Tax=Mesorhizobium marinum TaxID=3228790 RepID=A0ABV3QUT0_9HYPH